MSQDRDLVATKPPASHRVKSVTDEQVDERSSQCAQVAELVDALGSGPSGGNTVEVRVFSWAPLFRKNRASGSVFSFLHAPFFTNPHGERKAKGRPKAASARAMPIQA